MPLLQAPLDWRGNTKNGQGLKGTPAQGGGGVTPTPPAGFALRQTSDGQYVQDTSGNYEIVRAA